MGKVAKYAENRYGAYGSPILTIGALLAYFNSKDFLTINVGSSQTFLHGRRREILNWTIEGSSTSIVSG